MENRTQAKTSPKLAVFYGCGEVGCQMSWYMINSYLTIFYTDIVGLSASAISLIMLIARIWDAINDPMMGQIADKTHTKWGKFRPYLMFAPPVLAIFNILTFTVFPVKGTLKAVLCLLFYIGAGMAYTVCATAYAALVNVIAKDSQVRMNLSTARGIGSSIAGIALAAFVMPMILHFGNGETATAGGYFKTVVIISLAMLPFFWLTAFGCKETYTKELHVDEFENRQEQMGFFKSLKELAKNEQLVITMLSTLTGTICVMGRMGLLAYYIIYVVGSYQAIAYIFTIMTVAQLIGNLFVPWGTKKFGKRNFMILLQVVMIIGFVILFLFPINNVPFIMAVSFVCGLCNAASTVTYGMISDCIEYGDWKLGRRQEGLAGSFLGFGVKIATAICGSLGVLLLAATGYVPNAEQTEAAKQGINFVVNIVPAIIGAIGLIPLAFYKLTPKRVAEIRAELDEGKHAYDKEEMNETK